MKKYAVIGFPLLVLLTGCVGTTESDVISSGSVALQLSEQLPERSYFLLALSDAMWLIIDGDEALLLVVWTSIKIALIAVIFASLIGIPSGLFIALSTFYGKSFIQGLLNTLMALPTVVVGLILYGLFSRQGILGSYGLLYTQTAIVIGQAVLILPVVCNLSIAAANSADPRLGYTCTALRANFLQRLLVYCSEVRFAIMIAIVTAFGRAIGEVGIAMMLGGNIQGFTRTMTTAIALETSKGDFEFALALGVILLLVAFLVNFTLQFFQGYK